MSIEAVGDVLNARLNLGGSVKMVLLGLANHADPNGSNARPSIPRLSTYAEISDRSIQRALRDLEDPDQCGLRGDACPASLIACDRRSRGGAPSVYRLNMARIRSLKVNPDTVTPLSDSDPDTMSPPAGTEAFGGDPDTMTGSPERNTVTPTSPSTVTPVSGNGDTHVTVNRPEPSLEPSEPETPSAAELRPTPYTAEFERFWSAYPLHKDKRKAFRAFREARKRATLEEILAGVARYVVELELHPDRDTKFAEGWLRGDRWLDEPAPVRQIATTPKPSPSDDYERRLEEGRRAMGLSG